MYDAPPAAGLDGIDVQLYAGEPNSDNLSICLSKRSPLGDCAMSATDEARERQRQRDTLAAVGQGFC